MDMYEEDTELMLLNKRLEKLESLVYKMFQIVVLKREFKVDPNLFLSNRSDVKEDDWDDDGWKEHHR